MSQENVLVCEMLLKVINKNVYNVLRLGDKEINKVIKDNNYIYHLSPYELERIIKVLSDNFTLTKSILKKYYLSCQQKDDLTFNFKHWIKINNEQILTYVPFIDLNMLVDIGFFLIDVEVQDISPSILTHCQKLIVDNKILYSPLICLCGNNLNNYFCNNQYVFKKQQLKCDNIVQQIFLLGISKSDINIETNIPLLICQKGNYSYVL